MSRKGENIYKRKDNRWEARYIKGYDEKGRAKYGYLYAQSYREARERLERAKVCAAIGEPQDSICSMRFSAYCSEWLAVNRHKITESTYVKYASVIEKHIGAYFGGLRAESITTAAISQFTDYLISEKGLSAKTARDVLTILGSVLKYARKRIGPRIPDVEIIYPKCAKNEMRVLSLPEQERLVAFLLSDMDNFKFGILLALITGMRIGELCALRWENVIINDRYIKIDSTMQRLRNYENGKGTKIIITTPKSDNSARVIPLTDYAVELCRRFCSEDARAFVLTGASGQVCEPRKMQYRFAKITEQLGLCGVHFHSLRHTFATRCVEVGFEIKSLSEILGHATPKITLERYVHSSFELKRDNMQKLCSIGF